MEPRDPHIFVFIMIFTLILFSSALSLLHYLGLQEYLLVLLGQPLEYYIGATAALIAGRVALALYRLIPVYRRFAITLNQITNSLNKTTDRLNSVSRTGKPGSRSYSTSSRSTVSAKSFKTINPGQVNKLQSNQSTTPLNVLTLLRSKYLVIDKMVSLSNKIGTTLFKPLAFNNMLAHGRIGRLAGGVNKTRDFIAFLVKMYRHHGTTYTIKWLKSCHVAIARCLGRNKVISLRSLEPDYNLPRLVNGLPKIIPFGDRMRIRRGDARTIRFWLGLFNIYRVLKANPVPKLSTITAPWTGQSAPFRNLLRLNRTFKPFNFLRGYEGLPSASLVPWKMLSSQSASPSNKIALTGVFTDVYLLQKHNPALWDFIHKYLEAINATTFLDYLSRIDKVNKGLAAYDFWKDSQSSDGYHLSKSGKPISPADHSMVKTAIREYGIPTGDGLSQFAIKYEAAGKVRVFALVDIITQSVFKPLHDKMFDILRLIPNDGTFDQESSVERSMRKATDAGCAFSFDLSAATDRLPVLLTEKILGGMMGNYHLARLWKSIMTKRDFGFLNKVAEELGLDEDTPYRYAVGQPMGALSSWAGLAITHHWIVQVAARDVHPLSLIWFEGYEVLGDDIVIFDPLVADRYLEIMTELGCEINLSKSIISRNRPVFEFAKRICWGDSDVSGISFGQVLASWNVGARLASVLQFAKRGLLNPSSTLMSAILSRDALSNGRVLRSTKTSSIRDQKARALGLLALLGERYQSGIIPLKEVMKLILNPKDFESGGDAVAIPIQLSTQLAYAALTDPSKIDQYKPSQDKEREYIWDWKRLSVVHAVYVDMINIWNEELDPLMLGLAERWRLRMFYPLYYQPTSVDEYSKEPVIIPMTDVPADYRKTIWDMEDLVQEMFLTEIESDYLDLQKALIALQEVWDHDPQLIDIETISEFREEVKALLERIVIRPSDNKKPNVLLESAKVLQDVNTNVVDIWQYEGMDYAFM